MKKLITIISAAAVILCAGAFTAYADDDLPSENGEVTEEMQDDIPRCEVSFKYESYTYTGREITPDRRSGKDEVTVTLDGETLVKDKDYTISYENNIDIGFETARLTVAGTGDHTGKKDVPFTIKPATPRITGISTSNDSIRAEWSTSKGALGYQILYARDSAFTRDVHSTTVTDRNYVNLSNIPKAGERWFVKVRAFITDDGTVLGTRFGSYSASRSITVKGNIKKVTIPSLNYSYKGREIMPTVTVRDTLGQKLVNGTDYTYTIKNNVEVGTASITVKGKGKYQGTVIKNFNVVPNDLSDNRATIPALRYIYAGYPVKPKPTLKIGGEKLVRDRDYYVTYHNNDQAGTATVSLTGIGNYKGTTSRVFTLVKPAGGTTTVNGTTYYADSKGNVSKSVSNGVVYYSDKVLQDSAASVLKKAGYQTANYLPAVDINSITQGTDEKKIVLTWKHLLDDKYTGYLLLRGNADGSSWKVLKEVPAKMSKSDYKYTDNISKENLRYFRYALAGVADRGGKKYISPLTFDQGWAKIKICLDPGHYIGAKSNGVYSEGTQMLLLGGKLYKSLSSFKAGGTPFAFVKITRTGDGKTETFAPGIPNEKIVGIVGKPYSEALHARGAYSEGCDFFISLHTNATGSNSWYTPNNWSVNPFINHAAAYNKFNYALVYELGLTVSQTIAPGGVSIQQRSPFRESNIINKDNDKGGSVFAVNRAADEFGVPGMLIEQSFHTNPLVREWMLSDSNLAVLGRTEAVTIARHYGFPVQ